MCVITNLMINDFKLKKQGNLLIKESYVRDRIRL